MVTGPNESKKFGYVLFYLLRIIGRTALRARRRGGGFPFLILCAPLGTRARRSPAGRVRLIKIYFMQIFYCTLPSLNPSTVSCFRLANARHCSPLRPSFSLASISPGATSPLLILATPSQHLISSFSSCQLSLPRTRRTLRPPRFVSPPMSPPLVSSPLVVRPFRAPLPSFDTLALSLSLPPTALHPLAHLSIFAPNEIGIDILQ